MTTDWELRYQTGDTAWDKGRPAPGLLAFLRQRPLEGRVLVPGCGFGHDAAAIAARSPDGCHVVGLDIAPSAVAGARARYRAENLEFRLGDFLRQPEPPEGEGSFDALFEHTLFCAINPGLRQNYAAAAARVLRPGGLFLAVFYMNPDPSRGEGPPFGCCDAELDELFSPFFECQRVWAPDEAFPGREGREAMRILIRR